MTTHKGLAVLVLEDGRKFDSEADLTATASGTWEGTLTFHDADLIPVLVNVQDGHIHVNDRPGEFIRPNVSDWTANGGAPFVMRILGSGPAPF